MTKWEWERFRDEMLEWLEDDEHRVDAYSKLKRTGTGPLSYVMSLYYRDSSGMDRDDSYLRQAAREYFVPALDDEIFLTCEEARKTHRIALRSNAKADYYKVEEICNEGFQWLKMYFESPQKNNDDFSLFSPRYFNAGSREQGSIEYGRESLLELGNPARIKEYTLLLQFYKGDALYMQGAIKYAIELLEDPKEEDIDIKALLAVCYWYNATDVRKAYVLAQEVLHAPNSEQCNRLLDVHAIIAGTYRMYPEIANISTKQGGMEEAHHFISRLVSRDDDVGEWAREEIKKYQKNQYGSYIYVE